MFHCKPQGRFRFDILISNLSDRAVSSWKMICHDAQLVDGNAGQRAGEGDLLPDCLIPVFAVEPDPLAVEHAEQTLKRARLIVVTQSCDLENHRVEFVALCPIHTLEEFEASNPEFAKKGQWENVRKGRIEGLHLLASAEAAGQ